MGVDTNPTCSDHAGEIRPRATAYTWACPNCGTANAKQSLSRQVVCPGCGQPFPTVGTHDKFGGIDSGEPYLGGSE